MEKGNGVRKLLVWAVVSEAARWFDNELPKWYHQVDLAHYKRVSAELSDARPAYLLPAQIRQTYLGKVDLAVSLQASDVKEMDIVFDALFLAQRIRRHYDDGERSQMVEDVNRAWAREIEQRQRGNDGC